MNDLRARIADIVARDRARRGGGLAVQTETLSTRRDPSGLAAGFPPRGGPRSAPLAGVDPFEVRERRIPIDELGLEIVGRAAIDPVICAHLGLKGEAPDRWEDVLFLDTETTGLAGGTGTYVFLIGIARFADGELILRQHLLLDLAAERDFIAALKQEIEPFRACASYNGKTFDLPILRTRFVMTLRSEVTVDESHLDLLHPARRLWRDRFGSTTLRQLEESVLDDGRVTDIPC